ncbi:DUF6616 family protein [Sphingobium sp. B2]|uniref:DUF6616 family protein n=1 Tax=Sphingobium sp. B2 TaxID=2583228 RepID=UPI0011AA1883|nr:DUF6616 family protein [Sphingobium sp. B2]
MSYIFIELFNYTEKWRGTDEDTRRSFIAGISGSLDRMPEMGIEIIAYGFNDRDTDQRAPYDFFCVYKVPNRDIQVGFETNVRASGWLDYFEQVNIRGVAQTGYEILDANVRLELPAEAA